MLAGAEPEPLVFDARLTTYAVLDELGAKDITWLTLRQRGRREIQRLQTLPDSAWTQVRLDRAGSYRHPQPLGRSEPTLLIANDLTSPAKQLFARYAERMLVENELAYLIAGFHSTLPRYERAQPERLHRDFTDAGGTITVDDDGVTVALNPKAHTPVLLDAGYADLHRPIPWWNNRALRFTIPPG